MTVLQLPAKIYFRIGEVARILGVAPHVVRFWESQFSLRPQKSRAGQRVYARRDVERLITIKRLLREEKFTIDGAKKFLREHGGDLQPQNEAEALPPRHEPLRTSLLALRERLTAFVASLQP